MALRIRLRRMGRKKAPHYRIVVAEASMPRDGRFVDTVGHYNPRTDPLTLVVNQEKARHWLRHGAKPTETVDALLRRAGVYRQQPDGAAAAVASTVKVAGRQVASLASSAATAVAAAAAGAAEAVRDAAAAVVERVQDAVLEDADERPDTAPEEVEQRSDGAAAEAEQLPLAEAPAAAESTEPAEPAAASDEERQPE